MTVKVATHSLTANDQLPHIFARLRASSSMSAQVALGALSGAAAKPVLLTCMYLLGHSVFFCCVCGSVGVCVVLQYAAAALMINTLHTQHYIATDVGCGRVHHTEKLHNKMCLGFRCVAENVACCRSEPAKCRNLMRRVCKVRHGRSPIV